MSNYHRYKPVSKRIMDFHNKFTLSKIKSLEVIATWVRAPSNMKLSTRVLRERKVPEDREYFVLKTLRLIFEAWEPEIVFSRAKKYEEDLVNLRIKLFHTHKEFQIFLTDSSKPLVVRYGNAYQIGINAGKLESANERRAFREALLNRFKRIEYGTAQEFRFFKLLKLIAEELGYIILYNDDLDALGIDFLVQDKYDERRVALFQIKSSYEAEKGKGLIESPVQQKNPWFQLRKENTIKTIVINPEISDGHIQSSIREAIKYMKN